ncbi:MAG TPA: tetratricopeptide repeat protein [Bacteroidales bacterium]|nr:tetratricopeptide repeat protein [Bacteroidales bacterium]
MKEKNLKYIFRVSAFLLLIVMVFASRDAGISCDEMLHYGQSVRVYNYFATGGADRSALQDTDLNLKYYGQSYDNIVTFVTKWLDISDIYSFRHLMSVIMGWLTIVVTALFAKHLRNYTAAFVTLFLFAISPVFIGHSYNNLKDVPFAFAYISGIWFIIRFIEKSGKVSFATTAFLTLTMAFCISIRAGGLILICYLLFFFVIYYILKYIEKGKVNSREIIRKSSWIFAMSLIALLLSSLLWPYALQDPLRNIIGSYRIMAHYPATFRQLFEGKLEWSDYMPWYYLFKSMAITIPVVVLAGLIVFSCFIARILKDRQRINYAFLSFTLVFPLVFVVIERSNLYSSWRQFLFVYPVIIILSSTGITFLFDYFRNLYARIGVIFIILLLTVHPLKFMIKNHPYEYTYYNELTGGVKGAYGKYELDYYYTAQTEAAEWLTGYLEKNNVRDPVKVTATYDVSWLFRNHPEVKVSWIRFEERSMSDWDYAIITNRYIPPFQLKNKIWPPDNSIHEVLVDGMPVCAVVKRSTKDDYLGYEALNELRFDDAERYFTSALKVNSSDEMIFYNFAGALSKRGKLAEADSALQRGLELSPGSDLILMFRGNIAKRQERTDEAIEYYRRVIGVNRKFFEAYVELSELVKDSDVMEARELLRNCLTINPKYKPAITALGDTYRESNPDIAEKYYEQARNIN